MDWSKAKTLTIIFLLLLDIFLGMLNYRERDKYTMSARQIGAITDLLNKNNIRLKTALPHSYRPMRQLSVSGYAYDESELIDMFFSDPANARREDQPFKTVYVSGDQTLTLQNGHITFDCPSGSNKIELTEDNAVREARGFLAGKNAMQDFVPDSVYMDSEGCWVRFCQKYKNDLIYTNYAEFLITGAGIVRIDSVYSNPKGYAGPPAEICAVDEIMLHFMQFYKDAYKDLPAEVTKIDLVYYQKEGSTNSSDTLTAVPHYRIEVAGFDMPFLIDAYLNRLEQV